MHTLEFCTRSYGYLFFKLFMFMFVFLISQKHVLVIIYLIFYQIHLFSLNYVILVYR
jgi:hypothetical protein